MERLSPKLRMRLEKIALFTLLLLPLAMIGFDFARGELGANPVEAMTHRTGDWSMRILLASLAVTPLRIIFGWRRPIVFRRMLGLYAFFYACLHFGVYLVFDQGFDFADTAADIVKRPYITVGFGALLLMIPLAVTSTSRMVKRLGAARWRRLHKLVYGVGVLGVMHYLWLVKADITGPALYGAVLAALLLVRVYEWRRVLKANAAKPRPSR